MKAHIKNIDSLTKTSHEVTTLWENLHE